MEDPAHHAGAAGIGHELAVIADQATRGNAEGHPGLAAAGGLHVDQFAAALAELLDDDAGIVLVDVDLHLLDRLKPLAGGGIGPEDHPGPADRQLESFAPHRLDQHAELQLAAAGDLELVLVLRFAHADGDVAFGFPQQAGADHPARHLVALAPGKRRIVDRDAHRQGRRIDGERCDRRRHRWLADGIRHRGLGQAGDGDDVARRGLLDRHALQPAEGEQLGQTRLLDDPPVLAERLDRHVEPRPAGVDPPGEHAAQIGIVFEGGRQHGEGRARVAGRRRHVADDQVEERRHVAALLGVEIRHRPAFLARSEKRREVELLVAGAERGKQVKHQVMDNMRPRVRPVDLVDDDDRPEAQRERLRRHELGLRHRALGRVDQNHDPVHHAEDPFHLAAEIGVARRIDDVEAHTLPGDRRAFRKDGDAALTLQLVGIERALGDLLVRAEGAALAEQLVDQGGLAVVDMGDDRQVAEGRDEIF